MHKSVNGTAIISAQNVTKTYGKKEAAFTALTGINLEITEGETYAIIGKSGSGKSTLMHILALLDKPTTGKIFVRQQDASVLPVAKINALRNKEFGFVFQQFFLNAHATVLENVILPLKIAGINPRERRRRGLEVLQQVELKEKAGARANDLSGGQKQRVALARALVNQPSVIFADEPTGNLDSVTGQKIADMLFDLNARFGITLIIVTHDHELAKRCRYQIHIKDGSIVPEAEAREAA